MRDEIKNDPAVIAAALRPAKPSPKLRRSRDGSMPAGRRHFEAFLRFGGKEVPTTSKNRCPTCQAKIKASEVACRRHWFRLPKPLRDGIWRLYREAPGSDAHRALVFQAIELLAPKPEQTKVRCMKCGFLVGKAGPCSEHSPFRQTGPGGRVS